jgi:hypothetical protein
MVYVDGKIVTGPMGVDYGNQSRFFFSENEDTRFDDVKTMIYRRLGLMESQHFLSINSRYNTGGVNAYHFCLVYV